ncbi:pimeloyl-ACP methyl ester carboxylesterase [Roseibium hamelinense]|uniref:Pimeloyl-ACP methyl ester carboxylesterase n=1 Tax=Roseibium hamelinense TaxID=150831 RepID=A0A562SKQ5_9HYPH|nr:alpha/beta hydrolase [Roseibium hamelinense]MTI43422.1 alpha/beta hydrolase [Roseibium hamelinense]TWI81879.1 pimeloyl-ACP methyl ester carboxylesterase [Roseibium hamelinense]
MTAHEPQFIDVGIGENLRKIAVLDVPGTAPGLLWLSGFKSDMTGTKAEALGEWAQKNGHRCTRFDYSGHGSSGGVFENACVSDWLEEASAVFDRFCDGPTVLVGSSMGGWIALLLALKRRETAKVAGMVLIAPATDFTEELMWKHRFNDKIRETIQRDGRWEAPSEYSEDPYVITQRLIEDGRKHLILDQLLRFGLPITILQGARDVDVPWQHAERLVRALPDDDVVFSLVPDGDHRLSRPQDIDLLLRSVETLASSNSTER